MIARRGSQVANCEGSRWLVSICSYPNACGKSRHRAWDVNYMPIGCSLGYRGRPLGGLLVAICKPLGSRPGPLQGFKQGALQGVCREFARFVCKVFAGSLQGALHGLCRVVARCLHGVVQSGKRVPRRGGGPWRTTETCQATLGILPRLNVPTHGGGYHGTVNVLARITRR